MQICQKADRYYNCGRRGQPIWLMELTPGNTGPFKFRIEYPWGSDWRQETEYRLFSDYCHCLSPPGMYCRITMFDFVVEDTQEKPTVTFIGEEPYLQYVSDLVHGTAWNS